MNNVIIVPYNKLPVPAISDWLQCDYELAGQRSFDATARLCAKSQFDWVTADFVREFTARFNSGKKIKLDLICKDSEVLKYDIGSHFTSHVDRIRGPGNVGTLVVVINSDDLEGGVLTIKGKDVLLDAYMAYIPVGVSHSVSAVTKGVRYVYKTAVFATNLPEDKKINILEYRDVLMNPYTRILASTGLRLPTQEETKNARFPNNAIHLAMNNSSAIKRD